MTLLAISTMDGSSITVAGTVTGPGTSMDLDHDDYTPRILTGNGLGFNAGCRSTIGNIIGSAPSRFYKFYVEVNTAQGDASPSFPDPANAVWGLASANAVLSSFGDGHGSPAVGLLSYDSASGHIVMDGATVTTIDPWTTGTISEGMFDIAGGTAAFRIQGGTWTDPIDISSLGGRVYVYGGMQSRANFNGQWLEFNLGQKPMVDTVPDGFNAGWGTPTLLIGVLTWDGNRIAP